MRALAFFALSSIAATGLVFLACSSDDTNPATPGTSSGSSGTHTSSSSGSSGTGTGTSGNVKVPEGGTLSTDGTCIIYCSPYQKAGTIASVPRDGVANQVAWENPQGALEQDSNNLAKVTLSEGQESQFLEVTNFDFSSIGDDKQTWGIQVELTRQSDDGGAGDALIEVIIDGKQDKVRPKVLTLPHDGGLASWPRVQIGTHHYGQAVDTWGVDLNPVDVRKPTFGARIAAKRLPGITSAPVVASVDALRVSVCSCVPNSAK
jgi:hypothetical protein